MSTSDDEKEENDTLILKSDETDYIESGLCGRFFKTKSSRLSVMLGLIVIYFFAEVIVGHFTNSLTLVADSFHMLSDGLSLCVALTAVRMSKRLATQSIKPWLSRKHYFNTFGWVRFEVVGALINSTFLLALCVSIFLEAVEKFMHPELTTDVELVLAVGAGGLLINVVGLVMFGSHAHAGHDHGHGHGHDHGHGHAHDHNHHDAHNHHGASHEDEHHHDVKSGGEEGHVNNTCHHGGSPVSATQQSPSNTSAESKKSSKATGAGDQMNMKAVFLHVLGDALGSVIVMITALVVMFVPHVIPGKTPLAEAMVTMGMTSSNNTTAAVVDGNATATTALNDWIVYLDPTMSLVLVLIMVTTTVPLFKQSSLILLQTVPQHIELGVIKERIKRIDGVKEIHDFHIWQLTGEKLVATVHLQCDDAETYQLVAAKIKERLHDAGIHSTTVQPEFHHSTEPMCGMQCATDECKTKLCCSVGDNISPKKRLEIAPTGVVTEVEDSGVRSRKTHSGSKFLDMAGTVSPQCGDAEQPRPFVATSPQLNLTPTPSASLAADQQPAASDGDTIV